MQNTITLSDFLEQSGARYFVYDMGRGIRPLGTEQFLRFESASEPYPYPLQQHAWLAILGQHGEDAEGQFIWFLKFPLDERGLLIQGTRDDFMARLIESHAEGGESREEAPQSPYGFKPKESVMAAFHAIATRALGQEPSRYYDHARSYLSGEPGYDQWAFVGIQGLADVAARLDELDNRELLQRALPQLPSPTLVALCGFLENVDIDVDTAEVLQQLLQNALADTDINNVAALLRAFSTCSQAKLRDAAVHSALHSKHRTNVALLAAIASRNWQSLHNESLAHDFCEALAQNSLGHDAFTQIMADLLYLPGLRTPLLMQLRDPDRSAALAEAVGVMFNTNQI
jgi:hypothetical protein